MVPTFDGTILNWRPFWEQFQAAAHDKPCLGDVDKLTYLRDALKGGPAMYIIQGLTQTAESYAEAIKCIKDLYNRPRVTHHEHVQSILQAPIMEVCSGKDLGYFGLLPVAIKPLPAATFGLHFWSVTSSLGELTSGSTGSEDRKCTFGHLLWT